MTRKITISENGIIIVPDKVRMNIIEIADLFDSYYPIVKNTIRAIEKQGLIYTNSSQDGVVEGLTIRPEYYNLEMVLAVSFQLQTLKAKTFREWTMQKLKTPYLNVQAMACEKWKDIALN